MKYSTFNAFARGYSHIQADTVCQDASYSFSNDEYSIIAVADGHGSKQYCRSDRGSQLAVDCAVHVIEECLGVEEQLELFNTEKRCGESLIKICRSIIAQWHIAIEQELADHPFTDEELEKIPEKYAERYRGGHSVEKAFGTTLIVVFTVAQRCFGIQIGDGKCVAVYKDGSVNEPIPWDENCCFNVTTSLCDAEASLEFRTAEIHEPAAVFIGTDGIDDTYGESLSLFYLDVSLKIAENGLDNTAMQLSEYMSMISEKGSHDDVSVACIADEDALKECRSEIISAIDNKRRVVKLRSLQSTLPDLLFRSEKENKIFQKLKAAVEAAPENNELQIKCCTAFQNCEAARLKLEQLKHEIEMLENEIASLQGP